MNPSPPPIVMNTPARPRVAFTSVVLRPRKLNLWLAVLASLVVVCAACGVGEKREGIPAAAQEAVDGLTEDIAAGRAAKIHEESADEWRQAATAEQSAAAIEQLRTRLGRVESRTAIKRTQQPNAGGALAGHTLELIYQTSFERGTGMENITLVERDGRWRLARYVVSSDLLQ